MPADTADAVEHLVEPLIVPQPSCTPCCATESSAASPCMHSATSQSSAEQASSQWGTPLTEPRTPVRSAADSTKLGSPGPNTTAERLTEPTSESFCETGHDESLASGTLPGSVTVELPAPPQLTPAVVFTRRRVAWLTLLALLALLALGTCSLCIACFVTADDGPCSLYLPPLRALLDRSRAGWRGTAKLLRLLNSIALVVGTVVLIHCAGELHYWILFHRRTRRYERRTFGESRATSTAKKFANFRRVMELMHDSSLKVSLSFERLSYRLRDGTQVLQDATGTISADEITVLMGPSGCGKSTLLALLSGKLTPTHGHLKLNGRPGSVRETHKLIGFVPQVTSVTPVTSADWLRAADSTPSAVVGQCAVNGGRGSARHT